MKKLIFTISLCLISIVATSCQEKITQEIDHDPSCKFDTGMDGEGCAALSVDTLTVGELQRFTLTYTAGDTGIPVGGGIAVGLHHGSDWAIQVDDPSNGNWLTAETGRTKIAMEDAAPIHLKMFSDISGSNFSNRIFNNIFLARIADEPLPPQAQVVFTFGTNRYRQRTQKYTDKNHEIRVTTDIDGDGVYDRIAATIMFEVVASEATQFSANTPSQVALGQSFPVTIRAEDEFYNLVDEYTGLISIHDEHGKILAEDVALNDGLANTEVTLDTAGAHRLRITAQQTQLKGRSNPIRSYETLPETRLYWGDIHGHSGLSDGLGRDINKYFEYGRDVAALDIVALTDHGQPDWDATTAAVKKYHEPGRYVTLLAQEAGAKTDHMNIYFRRDNADHISRWQTDYEQFQRWVYNQYNTENENALTGPHHFAYTRDGRSDPRYPFGYWDNRVARFVEVYSSHGTSEFSGNPRPLLGDPRDDSKTMQAGLAKGLRFAVIGASDNHDSRPGRSGWGRYPNGLAGFWATELTREAIWNSLWNYQTYATSFDRIYTEFSLNGHNVGSDIDTTGSLKLSGYIIGKTDKLTAEILRDNETIFSKDTVSGLIELEFTDTPAAGEHFYYLRVTQDNGERAWTTPIWVNQK